MKKTILLTTIFFYCLKITYSQPGKLDPSFGNNGIVSSTFGTNTFYTSTAIQSDGKIVVGGSDLARYNSDGTLDSTFSQVGKLATYFFEPHVSVAIQSDGKIVVGDSALARYNTNGSIDITFATDGYQTPGFPIAGIAIQSDGKIVVVGTLGYDSVVLARYNIDGTSDITFSDDGKEITAPESETIYRAQCVTIQTDGKIVVAGYVSFSLSDCVMFGVFRYNSNGTLDTTFSNDGKQRTDFTDQSLCTSASSVTIQSDGKIVAAGDSRICCDLPGGDFVIARYHSDGALDTTFSADGRQIIHFATGSVYSSSVVMQNDGKIVMAGSSANEAGRNFTIVRLISNGSLDNTFGENGKQVTEVSEGDDVIGDIAIAGNKLYAVGFAQDVISAGVVARYLLDEENQNLTLSCPSSKIVSTDKSRCYAVVNNIDPLLQGGTAQINYTISGATVEIGTGSASGKKFNKGVTTVTYSLANDASKNCSFTVTVNDKETPSITNVAADPASLWPPNHKMQKVFIGYDVKDNCGFNFPVLSVSSNEANNADWMVADNHHVQLRAEKGVRGTERIYTITIGVTDLSGNKSTKTITIGVSKNKTKGKTNSSETNRSTITEEENIQSLTIRATPNPSPNYFTLYTKSNSDKPINVKVTDVLGRVVETRLKIAANGNLRMRNNYRPGIYFIEVRQGMQREVIKLVKQ